MPQPALLLARLDAIAASLSTERDALALLALGSVGLERERLDEHSDLDFFVIVAAGAKPGYLASIAWLERAHSVAFSFPNTADGRKALFTDGVFAEYAVFEPNELERIAYAPGRFVWKRDDVPDRLATPRTRPRNAESSVEWHVNEALTNLLVGLHRDARGEHLSAMRFIQVFAVDRVVSVAEQLDRAARRHRDPYASERRIERRHPELGASLAGMTQGYRHNRSSALTILEWLEARVTVDPTLASVIRRLCART